MIKNQMNKRKYTTRSSPRYQCKDYDIVFATNKPFDLYVTACNAYQGHRFTADPRKNKDKYDGDCDLCLTIDGKKHRLHQLLCPCPEGFEIDHIGGNLHDIRPCAIRVVTHAQNLLNRRNVNQGKVYQLENGKYIVRFPKIDDINLEFDTYSEAYTYLCKLQDEYFGDYGYRRSQEIAAEHETYLFHPVFYLAFDDNEMIDKIESDPYFEDINHEYILNMIRIKFRLLNAEYQRRYHDVTNHIEKQLISAEGDERIELIRTLNWLEDGRYVVDLPYFQAKFDEIINFYLSKKRQQ